MRLLKSEAHDMRQSTAVIAELQDQIHDRMPVILDPSAFDAWLNPAILIGNLKGMLLGRNLDGNSFIASAER